MELEPVPDAAALAHVLQRVCSSSQALSDVSSLESSVFFIVGLSISDPFQTEQMDGKELSIRDVCGQINVLTLKQKLILELNHSIEADRLQFMFQGVELHDSATLEASGVSGGSKIHAVILPQLIQLQGDEM